MLSTIGESPWLTVILIGLFCFTTCVWLYSLYSVHRIRTEFPTKTLLNALRAENDSLSGDFADLTARFSRFQKRQDMQGAREAKRSAASLQEEAATILQAGSTSSSENSKAELYKKARH